MITGRRIQYCITFLGILLVIVFYATASRAENNVNLSKSQTIYIPGYSHIYTGPKSHPTRLTAVVSIRNTDMVSPITLVSVDYYDSDGKLVRKYLTEDVSLSALVSTRYIVNISDKRGGSGANFIIKWRS